MYTRDSVPMSEAPQGTIVRCRKGHVIATLPARSVLGEGSARLFDCPTCNQQVKLKVREGDGA